MRTPCLALLLALAGCASGGQSQSMTEEDFQIKIATTIVFDPALIKPGDRVVYLVKATGEDSQRYSWAAVGEDAAGVWIENQVPFNPRPMVVKSKLDRSGKLLEQWIGEPGGRPGQTYPHPKVVEQDPKPVRDSSSAKAQTKEEPDRVVVGGRTYECTRVTTTLMYPDGRKSTMINWFSKEVPFPASKTLGGLVKRHFGRLSMELVAGDQNGKSELEIPPK